MNLTRQRFLLLAAEAELLRSIRRRVERTANGFFEACAFFFEPSVMMQLLHKALFEHCTLC